MTARKLGAHLRDDGKCEFVVWAPERSTVEVHLVDEGRHVPLAAAQKGYFHGVIDGVGHGDRYLYRLDAGTDNEVERPDPASRHQPDGVHGPSAVVAADFAWGDEGWRGVARRDLVLYELHVGAFTDEGSFEAAISRLDALVDLGVTAVELMPVAQFPGERNWGYDGVYPFAVQHSYGGPRGLKSFVDACHARGLGVILDVVYNHLGPEGNYLWDFGPYFTDAYHTPWGAALNFDQAGSDEVRRFFIENALQWIDEFHLDGLRLDATHAIFDGTAYTFLEEICEAVHTRADALDRQVLMIAESNRNDPRTTKPAQEGGVGFDAQWSDDLHHSLHALLTGERRHYYVDFGEFDHLLRAYRDGFTYAGRFASYRGRRQGRADALVPPEEIVVCLQNHDQVGNRKRGERLTELLAPEASRLAATTVLLSPFLPLLFMGEEYGEIQPFPYFVDHGDPDLVEAVREGRAEEFADFDVDEGEAPDPAAAESFEAARLRWERREEGAHARTLAFHTELLALRKRLQQEVGLGAKRRSVTEYPGQLLLERRFSEDGRRRTLLALNFGEEAQQVSAPLARGRWRRTLCTSHPRWGGPEAITIEEIESDGESPNFFDIAALSAVLFELEQGRGALLA